MKSTCKRSWEVEALEDGRLRDKDRASLERHVETCADCTKARSRVQEVGTLLAEVQAPTPTDLEHRRARAALLARADEAIVGDSTARRPRIVFVAALAALAALAATVAVFMFLRHREDSPVATRGAATSTSTSTSTIAAPPPAVVDTSASESPAAPAATVAVVAPAQPADVDAGGLVVQPRLPKTEAASATAPNAAPSAAMATPSPGQRFARAMSSFNAGDYGEAERAFGAFVHDFPSDSRAEDAMFLVADARALRGDTAGARDAARSYLRRFPNGLRAPAAERLAADPH